MSLSALILVSAFGVASGSVVMTGSAPDARPASPPAGALTRGWPFHLVEPIASPFFYDVNGDGTDEVIIADGSRAYVLSAAGDPLPGWPRVIPRRADNCGAAGDIDGDGQVEIIFGIEGAPPLLYVYRVDGTNKPGFPIQLPYRTWMNCSSPVLADLNGDGRIEIGIGVEIGVAFFDAQGHALPGWPFTWFTTQNLAWSAPAVGDIDGDGMNEVVVGENTLGSSGVYAIRADGTLMPGWPKQTSPVFSSPSLADIDGDGVLDVVAQDGDPTWMGYRLYAWHGDGSDVTGFPKSLTTEWNGSRANPAVGDVDGDGQLEIVTVTSDGYLHVVRSNGMDFAGYPKMTPGIDLISSPQLADVNADGEQEIFLAYCASNVSQWVSGWRLDGTVLPGFPKMLLSSSQLAVHGSTQVRDIDHDGVFELVACGTDLSNGSCCLYEVDGSEYQAGVTRCEWPKIRRDAANSGLYGGRNPAAAGDFRIAAGSRLTIAPNPTVAGKFVTLRIPRGEHGTVICCDPSGRVLGRRTLDEDAQVDVGDLLGRGASSGVYFVRFRSEEGRDGGGCRLVVLR
jgi:hypothetical protein